MMKNWLVINAGNIIENAIVAPDDWSVPGKTLIDASTVGEYNIGWGMINGVPTDPNPVPPQPIPTDDEVDLEKLNAALTNEGSLLRGIVELMVERFNAMSDAVESSTNLATLKASFPKSVTGAQVKTAIKNKMRS